MCVDPERGRYMAISTDNTNDKVIASSEAEALGLLVAQRPGIKIEGVISVETSEPTFRDFKYAVDPQTSPVPPE